jgi:uncharacterized protein (TIGR02646 family)
MRHIEHPPQPELLTLLLAVDGSRKWDSGGAKDAHEAMQLALWLAQNGMCAYCERPIIADVCLRSEKCPCEICKPNHVGHAPPLPARKRPSIEHFHPRNPKNPAGPNCVSVGDYTWTNLLLVCADQETCDGPQAKAGKCLCGQIVSPVQIFQGTLYLTVDQGTGEASPHPSLNASEKARMQKTIHELRLNNEALKGGRKVICKIVDQYLKPNPDDGVPPLTNEQIRWELRASGFYSTVEACLA